MLSFQNWEQGSALTTDIHNCTGSFSQSYKARIKGIYIGRKEIKLTVFPDDMIIYLENSKQSTKISPNLVSLARLQKTKFKINYISVY